MKKLKDFNKFRIAAFILIIIFFQAVGVSSQDVGMTPEDTDFRACANKPAPDGVASRTYSLTNNEDFPVTIQRMRLRPSGAPWSSDNLPTGDTVLQPGESLDVTIKFTPTELGESTVALRWKVKYRNPGLHIRDGRMDLKGEGKDCPDEGPGGGGNGGNGGDGGNDGNGGDGNIPENLTDVCVVFHIVTKDKDGDVIGPDTEPSSEDIDNWIAEANRVFRPAGVNIKRNKPLEGSDPSHVEQPSESNKEFNPHCINVYIHEKDFFPGNQTGETNGTRLKNWSNDIRNRNDIDNDFKKKSTLGRTIQLERENNSIGHTLAHELGHAMGLAPTSYKPKLDANGDSVLDDDGNPVMEVDEDHMDPETGDSITDGNDADEHLMKPESVNGQGNKITDLEKQIALLGAKRLATDATACGKGFKYMLDDTYYGSREKGGDLGAAIIENRGDYLIILSIPNEFMLLEQPTRIAIEFDMDLNGVSDIGIISTYDEASWTTRMYPPSENIELITYPELLGAFTPYKPKHPYTPYGLVYEIPKEVLSNNRGEIGWRVKYSSGKPERGMDYVPDRGFATFDITNPTFVLNLDPRSRNIEITPGEDLILSGVIQPSDNFTGDIDLDIVLWGEKSRTVLPLGSIHYPFEGKWVKELVIPMKLPVGEYDFTLRGNCGTCKHSTSVNGKIVLYKEIKGKGEKSPKK